MKFKIKKSREKYPRPDQEICLVIKVGSTPANEGRLFVFRDAPGVTDAIARSLEPGWEPIIGYHAGDNLVFWQTRSGSTGPWHPGIHQFLPCMETSIGARRPFLLYPDGKIEYDTCAKCPMETKLVCSAFGGFPSIIDTVYRHDRRLARECRFIQVAFASALSVDRLRASPGHIASDTPVASIGRTVAAEGSHCGPVGVGHHFTSEGLIRNGFWVTDRYKILHGDRGIEFDVDGPLGEKLSTLADLGVTEMDRERSKEVARDHGVSLGRHDLADPPRRGDESPSMGADTFDLDPEMARRAIVGVWLARHDQAVGTSHNARLRRDNCSKCVYSCPNRPGECAVTLEQVIQQYPNTDEARRWMAFFAFTGKKKKFERSHWIVWGPSSHDPDKPLGFFSRKLRPPYEYRKEEPDRMEEWDGEWRDQLDQATGIISEWEFEEQAVTFFALQQLWAYSHPMYDARFWRGKGETRNGRSRNDVLSIELTKLGGGRPTIYVRTDTRASCYGGRNLPRGEKPEPIPQEERPRFTTDYSYPFFRDIFSWTGEPLGTSKSHSSGRLRILD